MTKDIIPQEAERSKKLNEAIALLRSVDQADIKELIYYIYDLGGEQTEIAARLKVSRKTINERYPKKGKDGK